MRGELSISRTGNQYIEITVQDDLSRVEFLRVRMGLAEFAKAITGLGNVECEFDWYPKFVGMRHEVKVLSIPVQNFSAAEEERKEILAPYEVDGWMARADDLGNHHNMRRVADGYLCSVTFSRYVPVVPQEAES